MSELVLDLQAELSELAAIEADRSAGSRWATTPTCTSVIRMPW